LPEGTLFARRMRSMIRMLKCVARVMTGDPCAIEWLHATIFRLRTKAARRSVTSHMLLTCPADSANAYPSSTTVPSSDRFAIDRSRRRCSVVTSDHHSGPPATTSEVVLLRERRRHLMYRTRCPYGPSAVDRWLLRERVSGPDRCFRATGTSCRIS